MKGLYSILLLVSANIFMTLAWYGHLKFAENKKFASLGLFAVIVISWGIAFFEYVLQVPANRIGYDYFSLGQLKIAQEVITLSVFIPFAIFYMGEPFKTDYLWAGLCLLGAVYFMFRA